MKLYSPIVFTAEATRSHAAGQLYYDSTENGLVFHNSLSDISWQLGTELLLRVRNSTGSTLVNGAAVYINGNHADGTPTVALAQANNENTSVAIGLVTADIANNAYGFVCTDGIVNGLNTSGYTVGLPIYLSPSVAGGLTQTKPVSPNIEYRIGVPSRIHGSQGGIYIDPGVRRLGLGSANQVFGIDAAGTGNEYKTIQGTAGEVTVTHTAGAITISLPATITGPLSVSGAFTDIGDFIVSDAATSTKNYRFRTSGGDLDVDFAGKGFFLSGFTNPDYTGGQQFYMRLEHNTNLAHLVGRWGFSTSAFAGFTYEIDGLTGKVKRLEGAAGSCMGVATLVGGTVTVNTTAVSANTRIFLQAQNNSGTAGHLYISARTGGTSFTVTSTSAADTRTFAWYLVDPV